MFFLFCAILTSSYTVTAYEKTIRNIHIKKLFMAQKEMETETKILPGITPFGQQRRNMLKIFGLAAASAGVLAACNKDDNDSDNDTGIDLGSGDVGILNYAYALEQLEAAFYSQVVMSFASDLSTDERSRLTDIRNHEVAHREFFKAAITAAAPTMILQDLTVDFSSIDFGTRASVLSTAMAFEDLGVSAYNGAGKLIVSTDYLLIAGKIVSVEARHAAYIRDLLSNGSFAGADVVDGNGLEKSKDPKTVLITANTFLKTKISARSLPTS